MLVVETRLWKATYDGQLTEDITDGFEQASVAMDTENDSSWSMEAILTWAGWQRLTPYLDWVVPVLTVTYPNGLVRTGPLGRYLVLDSPETHNEITAKVKLQSGDPLWLLARQEFANTLLVRENTPKTRVVKDIIKGAVLTDDVNSHPLFAIPDKQERFKRDREWDPDVSRLEVCNEILGGAGCYPLWTTKRGILTSKAMGEARLRQRHPVRTYSANLPEGIVLLPSERPLGGLLCEVVGTIDTTPKGQDLVNEFVMVNDDPSRPRVRVRGRITHPKNPRSRFRKNGRRKTRKLHNPVVEEDATAQEVANAMLDELSTLNSTIRLTVTPDPVPEFARETVALHIYNVSGDAVAVGQYAVHRISFGLSPHSATMTIDCGRVDSADDLILEEVA